MRGMISVSTMVCSAFAGRVLSRTDRISTAWSAGLIFLKVGGVGISTGSRRVTADSADCTSSAAASILRSSANWTVMLVDPVDDDEVIWSMPEIVDNWRSIGVATDDAMVAGLAPGRPALDLDGRQIDLGQRRYRQLAIAEEAGEDDRQAEQDGCHRPIDSKADEPHQPPTAVAASVTMAVRGAWPGPLPLLPARVRTVSPGLSLVSASVTICSPGATPLAR